MEWVIGVMIEAIASAAAVAAAVIAGVTLNRSLREQKEGLIRQKKQATLDAYNALQSQVFDKIIRYKPSKIMELVEDKNADDYKRLSAYLARIEHFCVSLTNDIYDYETFYELAHGYFDSERGMLMHRILPLIEMKLDNSDADYFGNIHKVWDEMAAMTKRKSDKSSKV